MAKDFDTRPTTAVILARGLGTRMRAASDTTQLEGQAAAAADAGVKGMIDVGRPFLDYLVSALADAGITEVCLVIGPEHDMIREHFASLDLTRVRVRFAVQEKPLGTADAVAAARDAVGERRFLVLNSDNYYPVEALSALLEAPGSALLGFERTALLAESNIPEERIQAFAILDVDEDSHLARIIEKPDHATLAQFGESAPISMNAWLFTPAIFDACDAISPSIRGEYELASAVAHAIDSGETFTVVPVAAGCLDMSRRDDIAAVREHLSHVDVVL
ncbi:MAG: nucleotidyltransferase family protein [Bowdeniella nasicola]|nr:nucleotidyltransferase family protein [Bowdeniella nasicola]